MEARLEQKIPSQLESLLVPWKDEGTFMNIFLKCELDILPNGYEYFIKMRSKDHFTNRPDPVGISFYKPLETYWTTQASHSFTTPLKIFQFYEARQILQFNVFIRERQNHNTDRIQTQPKPVEYCSAEAKFSQICYQKPIPLVLKQKNGKEIGHLSFSIIILDGYEEDQNTIYFDVTFKICSKEAKFMKSSFFKIYGYGNKRDEIIEIFSKDCSPELSNNSQELNVTYTLDNIPLSSIFGNKDKQYCWFQIIFEGEQQQSEKKQKYLVFPVHKSTVLTWKKGDSITIKDKYDDPIPALLNQIPNSNITIQSASYVLSSVAIQEKITLEKFIHAGIKFNLIAGIDFTRSNGSNSERDYSLHTSTQLEKNPYIKALKVVAEILIKFDNDLLVPMYGFGGQPKLPHYSLKRTSYCFPIIGSEQYPELHELQGMMAAYLNIIDNQVKLDGPTYFKPLLQLARKTAIQGQKESDKNYYILLIITDGIINDNEQTAEEIKLCVDLPISIVIVGVGEENFDDMDYLNNIKDIGRDLVSFVRMEHYDEEQEHAFKSRVLEELPRQVTDYYKTMKITPSKMVNHFEEPPFEDRSGQEEWRKINDYKEAILQKYKQILSPYVSQI